jgi:hypothetical protein
MCELYLQDLSTQRFLGAETVDENWIKVDDSSDDNDLLDQSCNAGGGGGFQAQSSAKVTGSCFYGAWRRVTG